MARTQHQIDNRLSSLAVAFGNEPKDYIASLVCPRVASLHNGQYQEVSVGSRFQKVKTKIAYGAKPKEVESASDLIDYALEYYGLDAVVDLAEARDVRDDRDGMDVLMVEQMNAVMESMMIEHEEEVRDLAFADATYEATLRENLAAADKFDAADSNPIKTIREALQKPLAMPNTAVMGQKVFDALASNAAIIKGRNRTDGDTGYASEADIAALIGVDKVIVGRAWGGVDDVEDAPSARIWDSADNLALLRIGRPTNLRSHNSAAWAVTATGHGNFRVRRWFDPDRGPDGSEMCRPVDQRKVLRLSTRAGYLIKDCLT